MRRRPITSRRRPKSPAYALTERVHSFAPIEPDGCRALVLGTMPGAASLAAGEYYAHPQNAFWRVMADVLGEPPCGNYDEKRAMLLRHGIALWDVFASCERQGSSDAAIRGARLNDFGALFARQPQIEAVFLNGGVAHAAFLRACAMHAEGREIVRLPSTSPAHTMPYALKREAWRQLARYAR